MKNFIFVFVILFSVPALAQDVQSPEPTRLEVDQEANVIRVIVNEKEVAQFTSSGLMVIDDIEYGGLIRDLGRQGIREAINENSETPEDEGNAP